MAEQMSLITQRITRNKTIAVTMTENAVLSFSPFRSHVGLCVQGALPSSLWSVVKGVGVAQFVDLLKPAANTYTTEFQLLGLFCNLSAHLIT